LVWNSLTTAKAPFFKEGKKYYFARTTPLVVLITLNERLRVDVGIHSSEKQ
jgi:hypothetical protein